MRLAIFDARGYDRSSFLAENALFGHDLCFFDCRLNAQSAALATGFPAVCAFVNDALDEASLKALAGVGVQLVALRCSGFNNVDLDAAASLGVAIARVPEYSPNAVAEHAIALTLTLNRKIHRACQRVRECNFSLEGLVGFDMAGKTFGVVGTGRIGRAMIRIANGFGCRTLAFDKSPDPELEASGAVVYASLERLCRESDIVSLHVPLAESTRHLIDERAISWMKPTAILINTGRGALIETKALIGALKAKRLGGAGLDVYEEEEGVFFRDLSNQGIDDDLLARLLTFPNVVITAHQAFLTQEALTEIARATLSSVSEFEQGKPLSRALAVRCPSRR